jgi:hypothetical protein
MRIGIPPPPANYDPGYLNRSFASIEQFAGLTVTRLEAVDGVLLQSPDGSVYKVTVDNAGNLVTTSVPLGQNGAPTF